MEEEHMTQEEQETVASEEERAPDDFLVVGLGASAGGLSALQAFFAQVPAQSGVAYVVIMHLSPEHESHLSELLQSSCPVPVRQVTDTVRIEPDHVYVIPPGRDLSIADGALHLRPSTRDDGRRAPIDLFFRTLAEAYGPRAAAVVFSGTGRDGTVGLKRVKERGGACLAQRPEEAGYESMPRSAFDTGLVDAALPASEMPAWLRTYQQHAAGIALSDKGVAVDGDEEGIAETAAADEDVVEGPDDEAEALGRIFKQLRRRAGHTFTGYKRSTVRRRIGRRLRVCRVDSFSAYADYLEDHPEETEALFKDLLISVTNFFRDEEAFAALEEQVIPQLFAGKDRGDALRLWCCGCATGEEAYSLGMLLLEAAADQADPPALQLFASDLSEEALDEARKGFYPETIAADVSPARLKRFFTEEAGGYRVRSELREMMLFTPHNLLQDPPFSKLDLVSCRNLLIYLGGDLQQQVNRLFHYALKPKGFLFLGASETPSRSSHLFTEFDRQAGLFRSQPAPARMASPTLPLVGAGAGTPAPPTGGEAGRQRALGVEELHERLRARAAPPSVIVNASHDVLHFADGAAPFFQLSGGALTSDVLKLARPELRFELRVALHQVLHRDQEIRTRRLQVEVEGQTRHVELVVRPVREPAYEGQAAQILFHEAPPQESASQESASQESASQESASQESASQESASQESASKQRVAEASLRTELAETKEQLRSTAEAYEAAIEDLKASNEELQSMNEELQSTTEELETSQEETQSTNEELMTVNQELEHKVEETSRLNSDLNNLMASTGIATLFLDRELRIKRYTPRAESLFNVLPTDQGRPLAHLTHRLTEAGFGAAERDGAEATQQLVHLTSLAEQVLESLQVVECELQGGENRWYIMRIRPYRTVKDKIDGVVLTFVDITERRRAERQVRALNATLETRVEERTAQVRQLASKLTLAEQRERGRISQVIHDDFQQQLYSIQLKLSKLRRALTRGEEPPPEPLRDLEEAYTWTGQAIDTARDLTVDLSPPVLKDEGLADALQWLVKQMNDRYELDVDLQSEAAPRVTQEEMRTLLFQVIRELLFNVVKHADTRQATVTLYGARAFREAALEDDAFPMEAFENNEVFSALLSEASGAEEAGSEGEGEPSAPGQPAWLVIRVMDEGAGFAPEEEAQRDEGGFGLFSVRERLNLMGGTLAIDAAPGKGTRITVAAPVAASA